MATFPALLSGHPSIRYPLTRSTRVPVQVLEYTDFSEQRWRMGPILAAFTLSYSDLRFADVLTLRNFFDARKGSFEPFDIAVGSDSYANVVFGADVFAATERDGAWSVELPMRQVKV